MEKVIKRRASREQCNQYRWEKGPVSPTQKWEIRSK